MKGFGRFVLLLGLTFLWVGHVNAQNNKQMEKKKTHSEVFMFEKDLPWEPAGENVTRQVLGYDGQVTMVKVKFEKGSVGTPHTHYHTQVTYVVSGKIEFTVDGKTKIVSAGDAIYMEPDVLHGCVCLEAGVLIDCFTPMRADYIPKK